MQLTQRAENFLTKYVVELSVVSAGLVISLVGTASNIPLPRSIVDLFSRESSSWWYGMALSGVVGGYVGGKSLQIVDWLEDRNRKQTTLDLYIHTL